MMRSRSGRELPVMTIINCGCLVVLCLASAITFAHEGHKPLPTRGMEVNTETGKMVLTKSARTTLDVQTAEVGPQKVTQSLLAYGTLVSPWNRHAMVSSPLSGRIVELLVTPGRIRQSRATAGRTRQPGTGIAAAGDSQRTNSTKSVSQAPVLGGGRRQNGCNSRDPIH